MEIKTNNSAMAGDGTTHQNAKTPAKKDNNNNITVKSLFEQDNVKRKFRELIGDKMHGFVTSVLQCVASDKLLAKADPHSIYYASTVAAILDLPINPNLGFAYIIPFGNKATFVMGYKGYIQLAQRTGQFKTISVTEIYEGQIKRANPLTGYEFDFTKNPSNKIIGYAGYFKLINGFEKTLYYSYEKLKEHGLKYSPSYKKGFGIWKDNEHMAMMKTVIKALLSRYAPLSIAMQKAAVLDSAVINNEEATDFTYIDNNEEMEAEVKAIDEREEFDAKWAEEEFQTLQELYKLKKKLLSKEENDEASRILINMEVKSFKKLREILKGK